MSMLFMDSHYLPPIDYPETGLGQAQQAVAGALVAQIGTQVIWVQTGGYDTDASQGAMTGRYAELLSTLNNDLVTFIPLDRA